MKKYIVWSIKTVIVITVATIITKLIDSTTSEVILHNIPLALANMYVGYTLARIQHD